MGSSVGRHISITGSFGLSKNTSVGDPTPLSIFMVSFCRQAQCTRRLRGRALAQSACPSAQNSPRSYVPQAPGGKARENAHHARRRLCTFSRSVSDSVFRSICIVCPFLLLHRVATCPTFQHASFLHILATPTLPYFCGCELDFFLGDPSRMKVPTALSITRARSATYQYVRQNFAWPRGRVAAPAPAHAKK